MNAARCRLLLIAAPLAASLLLARCGQAQPAATSAAQPTPH